MPAELSKVTKELRDIQREAIATKQVIKDLRQQLIQLFAETSRGTGAPTTAGLQRQVDVSVAGGGVGRQARLGGQAYTSGSKEFQAQSDAIISKIIEEKFQLQLLSVKKEFLRAAGANPPQVTAYVKEAYEFANAEFKNWYLKARRDIEVMMGQAYRPVTSAEAVEQLSGIFRPLKFAQLPREEAAGFAPQKLAGLQQRIQEQRGFTPLRYAGLQQRIQQGQGFGAGQASSLLDKIPGGGDAGGKGIAGIAKLYDDMNKYIVAQRERARAMALEGVRGQMRDEIRLDTEKNQKRI
ncbi:hypothetical protein LCGC14_1288770, partial [marine sediment metagenome]